MEKELLPIRSYWDERAKTWHGNPKATTDDHWLRTVEIREITRALAAVGRRRDVLDVGCGDGFGTVNVWKAFPRSTFWGLDYSGPMIASAGRRLEAEGIRSSRIKFLVGDALQLDALERRFDVVISDRCLINLHDRKLQWRALRQIHHVLRSGGTYVMVENFLEGHNAMNAVRRRLGLKEIPVRWHNCFLDEGFVRRAKTLFTLVERKNISSIYYLVTRAVYSKLCQLEKKEPDYDHPLHRIAAALDETAGNYGPVNLLVLKKR